MITQKPLRIISCISEKADTIGVALASYLTDRLGIQMAFALDTPWQDREQMLDSGQAQIGWICGLLYGWKVIKQKAPLTLLAAPVMAGRWYQDRPIYYSDVVVHKDSPFHRFTDFKGASFAYNEQTSFSGYFIVRHHLAANNLAKHGALSAFFGSVIVSGAHSRSLQMIVDKQIDAVAIDSTALDFELQIQPNLRDQIRTIKMLGPNAIPPLVISTSVAPAIRQSIQDLLLTMHQDTLGRFILRDAHLTRFSLGVEQDYRAMVQMIEAVEGTVS